MLCSSEIPTHPCFCAHFLNSTRRRYHGYRCWLLPGRATPHQWIRSWVTSYASPYGVRILSALRWMSGATCRGLPLDGGMWIPVWKCEFPCAVDWVFDTALPAIVLSLGSRWFPELHGSMEAAIHSSHLWWCDFHLCLRANGGSAGDWR